MRSNLDTLRELTEQLSMSDAMPDAGVVTTEDGQHIALEGWHSSRDGDLSILKTTLAPGVTITERAHSLIEVFIIYCGACTVSVDDAAPIELAIGDSFKLLPNSEHKFSTDVGVGVVAITIPAAAETEYTAPELVEDGQ